jgi:adenosylhomocysteine nucleosidase
MTALFFDDPCVLFAMRRESAPFCREFRPQQGFPGSPCRARFCGPTWLTVLVVETGIGREPTQRALDWLLSAPRFGNLPYRPKLVLSAGFAGALDPGLAVGDIVLATEFLDPNGCCRKATWPTEPPQGKWQPPLHHGRILTSPALVSSPEQKQELARVHQALAVDMESSFVAEACAGREIPFGSVRAISDRAETPLSPGLATLLNDGMASLPRALLACLRSPAMAGELLRLAKDTRRAARQLGKAVGELLTLTLPWSQD